MSFVIDIHSKVPKCCGGARQRYADMNSMDAFLAAYDEIQKALIGSMKCDFAVDDKRANYLLTLMDETCKGGKLNRGLAVVEIARDIRGSGCGGQTVFEACVCGWMIEFMQAHFLIEDDIMDDSQMRRGKPCWYKRPGVTSAAAINDGLIVFAWCTQMADIFLSQNPQRNLLLTQFHDVDLKTCIGQFYDVTSMYSADSMDPDKPLTTTMDYSEFTISTYNRIVKHKTAYYTYHLPLLMGLTVVGEQNSVDAGTVKQLAMLMGEYFQIQDDFLDCYGDPAKIGKVGTDIQDVKCSWLAVTFLATASADDVATWKANYGKHDDAKVKTIKELYNKANLTKTFEAYEAGVVGTVEDLLKKCAAAAPGFAVAARKLWERTYKRTK